MTAKIIFLTLASTLLTACGGGSGGQNSPNLSPTPEVVVKPQPDPEVVVKPQPDETSPTLTQITEVTSGLTTRDDVSFAYNSDEAGKASSSGSCGSVNQEVVEGENTFVFGILDDGEYKDCFVTVIDDNGNSSKIAVNAFNIYFECKELEEYRGFPCSNEAQEILKKRKSLESTTLKSVAFAEQSGYLDKVNGYPRYKQIVAGGAFYDVSGHGVGVINTFAINGGGSNFVIVRTTNQYDVGSSYLNLDPSKVILFNISGEICFVYPDCIQAKDVNKQGIIVNTSSGNAGLNSVMKESGTQQAADMGATGLFIVTAGVNIDSTGFSTRSTPCGYLGAVCILARDQVYLDLPNAGGGGIYPGTSFAAPQSSAAVFVVHALDQDLTNREIVKVLLETAVSVPDCDISICGRGILSLENIVRLIRNLGEGDSIDLSALLTELESQNIQGVIYLSGLGATLYKSAFDASLREYPLVLEQGKVALKSNFVSQNWRKSSERISFSFDKRNINNSAIGFSLAENSLIYASMEGEVGFCIQRYLGFCLSYEDTEKWFGGYGTGSLAFGRTEHIKAHLGKEIGLNNGWHLNFGINADYAKAGDGSVVRNLRGNIISHSFELKKESKNSTLSFNVSYTDLNGKLSFDGNPVSLRDHSVEAGVKWRIRF